MKTYVNNVRDNIPEGYRSENQFPLDNSIKKFLL